MAIQDIDNRDYRGKKPNFVRDSFDTISQMKSWPETDIDEGHISVCQEDGYHYEFKSGNQSDPLTGKWRRFPQVEDNLSSESSDASLSAKMGNSLQTRISEVESAQQQKDEELKELIDAKVIEAGGVSFDTEPTQSSTNPVTSGGLFTNNQNRDSNTGISEYGQFSSGTSYFAGTIVFYQNLLYKFTQEHPAGDWTPGHVERTSFKKEMESKLAELSTLAGVYKIFDFSSENYLANFSDIKLKAGVEYFVYAETDSKEIRLILCSKKYNYIDGNYYEDGDYPRVTLVNGKGFIKIKNDTDTDLGGWGFQSSSTAKTGTVKFTFFASMSLGQSVSAINDEITDIKGYKQVNSNVLNLNSTVNLGDLQFQITANKKYLLKVDCSNPYNVTILGNPKLNYIDGNYYEDGDYPRVNLTNGQGSIVISNSTDINLSSFGFFSTETSAMYEGNYTFTLFELCENSVSLMSLNQMINDINGDIQDINEEIDDIRGYKQVNSKIINFNSSSFQGNLQFSITANKKYLLKIDCSESNNITLFGNPSLNYIDGNYYESGNSPKVKITNGKGSIILGNDKDTSLSTWGFFSAEGVVDHEGDYKFTLFELFELGENSVSLMSLNQMINNIPKIAKTNGFIRIFHSMGVIGDSLASGEIVTGTGTEDDPIAYNDRYNFSWLANIARKYGADWKCFSNGGQTAQGWLGRWLPDLISEENKRSLYFNALGTNDEGLINKGQLVLGTKESNSDEASFAGYYKKIIESVHAYSPHSIIMCCTTYCKQTVLSPINNLIQEISDLYDYCYFINIAQKSTFNLGSEYVRGGHFDTLGYVKFADALEILVNDVLEENKTKLVTWGVDAPN